MSSESISHRFEQFVRTLDGFEDVNALLKSDDPDYQKRADYLLLDRKIIIEQKVLETDPSTKPQKFVDRLMQERGIMFHGRFSTRVIFATQPDSQKLQRQLIHKLTDNLESVVSNADKQTRDTRNIFKIPDASGVLIILNKAARILTPELLVYRIGELFGRKLSSGSRRYGHIDAVVLISEIHPIRAGSATLFPIQPFIDFDNNKSQFTKDFVGSLIERWAKFNGIPLFKTELKFIPSAAGWPSQSPW